MADFSQDDRDTIRKYPLGDALDNFRDDLQKAEGLYESDQQLSDQVFDELASGKVTTQLLISLMAHEVALDMRSKIGNRNVSAEIATVAGRIRGGDFNYDNYRALVQLVIMKASDIDIWRAVIDLITSLSRTSPPATISPSTISPSFKGTPIVRSSASLQGHEQTKKFLNMPLFDEIKHCTYRNVNGFFTKYFEGKAWSTRSQEIYDTAKARHVDGRWVDFPEPAAQDKVWAWLSQFQKEYLSDAPGVYHKTENTSDLVGAEARRQLDLLVKRRSATGEPHDWKDVLVIGEHKQSTDKLKPMLLQLSRYIRDVYTTQPTRRFVHGFLLHGTNMELWVFDRSGPHSSGKFDINQEPERFIRALAGYVLMSDDELGLDNFIQREGDSQFITVDDETGNPTKITLEQEPFFRQRAIVCRGTTCFRSKDLEQVIKLSWPSDLRTTEAHHLQRARDYGVKGVARLFSHYDITSIEDMRDELTFPAPHRFRNTSPDPSVYFTRSQRHGLFQSISKSKSPLGKRSSDDKQLTPSKRLRSYSLRSYAQRSSSQRSKLGDESGKKRSLKDRTESQQDLRQETFKNRKFRCLVISPAGRSIDTFSSVVELLTALRDAIRAHQSLFEKAKILHRDISENNIIITNPETADGFTGMLIDLDLAIVDGERSGARHMTGTMEFMAIDVLLGVEHTYRHDLESFFYVLLWICARRAWDMNFQCQQEDRPERSLLDKWYGNNPADIAGVKRGHMHTDGFKDILKEFPSALNCAKQLCQNVRRILFPLTNDGELDLSTKSDPQTLYGPIIEAFETEIAGMAAEVE